MRVSDTEKTCCLCDPDFVFHDAALVSLPSAANSALEKRLSQFMFRINHNFESISLLFLDM